MKIASTCHKNKTTDSSLSVTALKITKHSTVCSWLPKRFVPSMGNIEKAVKIASTCLKIKITDFYFKCDSSKNDETFYNMVVAANNYMLNVQRFVPSI